MTEQELLERHIILFNNDINYIKINLDLDNFILLCSHIYSLCIIFSRFFKGTVHDSSINTINNIDYLLSTDINTAGINLNYIYPGVFQKSIYFDNGKLAWVPNLYYLPNNDNTCSFNINYVYIKNYKS